ncbi:hypothetical protein IU450_38590 [Nocardia abscessus]|uniref:hypothetical protein n=1 Tax=Nocardia abscessus TaxID=120957 RepID=UPI001895ECC6|nr:hypothetical protein [Nocardia abscessus]MBF6341745.1 hypothetical protein [Nocardia abscessus]
MAWNIDKALQQPVERGLVMAAACSSSVINAPNSGCTTDDSSDAASTIPEAAA